MASRRKQCSAPDSSVLFRISDPMKVLSRELQVMGKAFAESVEGARRSRELVRRWSQVPLSLIFSTPPPPPLPLSHLLSPKKRDANRFSPAPVLRSPSLSSTSDPALAVPVLGSRVRACSFPPAADTRHPPRLETSAARTTRSSKSGTECRPSPQPSGGPGRARSLRGQGKRCAVRPSCYFSSLGVFFWCPRA